MDAGSVKKPKEFVKEFLDEYLSDGIGAKTKREVDILIMNLLMNYADLARLSNQELSILLQAPVSKIKSLRYEARLKYPPEPDYVKKAFLNILLNSQRDFENGKIIFAIEDEFVRQSIQGQLKSKGMFADSSFNTELVKINRGSLEAVINELYGKEIGEDFHKGFTEMEAQLEGDDTDVVKAFTDMLIAFASETAKKLAYDFIRGRIGL
jgi:hypothetical protein